MSSPKREVFRTDKEFFSKAVLLCKENINTPSADLAEDIYLDSDKTLSACKSLISSIKCCINAFEGKASPDTAQYALAKGFEVSSDKEEILNEAKKHTNKPIETLKANYSYMYRVRNALENGIEQPMELMSIPKWLSGRPIYPEDLEELKLLFPEQETGTFSEISLDLLREFRTNHAPGMFYKLLRILGFYGVRFYRKLQPYSGPHQEFPRVLSFAGINGEEKLSDFFEVLSQPQIITNLGLSTLRQLHGVPIENFVNFFTNDSPENILEILPAQIVLSSEDFFSKISIRHLDRRSLKEIEQKQQEINAQLNDDNPPTFRDIFPEEKFDSLTKKINDLALSTRCMNYCIANGIEYVWQLVQYSWDDLRSSQNLGFKSVCEIKRKVEGLGLELGLTLSLEQIQYIRPPDINFDSPAVLYALTTEIQDLALSARCENFCGANNIEYVCQLVQYTEANLKNANSLGRKSVKEFKNKINDLGLKLNLSFSPEEIQKIQNYKSQIGEEIVNKSESEIEGLGLELSLTLSPEQIQYIRPPDIDFDSPAVLYALTTEIQDLALSARCENFCEDNHIQYSWQLVRYTETRLKNAKNLGRKSVNEFKRKVADLGLRLGLTLSSEEVQKIQNSPEVLLKVQNYKLEARTAILSWLKSISQKLTTQPIDFLDERELAILWGRVWSIDRKPKTLEDLGKEFSISRERIRQVEKGVIKKLRAQYRIDLKDTREEIVSQVESLGGLSNIENIDLDFSELSQTQKKIINSLLSLIDKKIYIDWDASIIVVKGRKWLSLLYAEMGKILTKRSLDSLFTYNDLEYAAKFIFFHNNISRNVKYYGFIRNYIDENKVKKLRDKYSFKHITKQDKIVSTFKELFPQGLDIYREEEKFVEELKKRDDEFQTTASRSINARLTDHPSILLWGRGFFVHKDFIKCDTEIVSVVRDWIHKRFDQGHGRFHVMVAFDNFQKSLQENGVPNEYALYTMLRFLEDDRLGQRRFPTIIDLQSDIEIKESILDELDSYFYENGKAIKLEKLKEEFVKIRGWQEYRLSMNLSKSDNVYPWNESSYIHQSYLNVNEKALQELVDSLRCKIRSIQGPYSLKGAKSELGVLWEQVCPGATTRTMVKLIKTLDLDDIAINGYFVRLEEFSSKIITASSQLEDHCLSLQREFTKFEVREEFCGNRGWTEPQFYNAFRKANFLKTASETYVTEALIEWDNFLSETVQKILKRFLQSRNALGQPHMSIEELVYEVVLPELPNNISWTRDLVKSIGQGMDEFVFFDDAYIATDNDFNIEDLDDMIGWLISRNFKLGIARKEKVEGLLWREGVLESGHTLPSNLFFEESSIQFREESNEVELSPVGISKYAKHV